MKTHLSFRFFINEDNDHYFKLSPERMNEKSLRSYVDGYADGGIDAISFCVNGQRASFRSSVLDAIWDPLPEGVVHNPTWPNNAKMLHDAGIDPYAVWLDQCHRRGLGAWISIRMNDCHHSHPSLLFRADRRWFQNPQWRRGPNCETILPSQSWQYYQDLQPAICWNYAMKAVRELMLAFFQENAMRYDADAFELDFSRDIYCLPPGREQENAHFLTEFLGDCRAFLDTRTATRGRRPQLVARVPWHPDAATAWGFDVREWCRAGLVDTIIAAPYWRSFQYDFPARAWSETTGGAIPVYPAIDMWMAPGPDLYHETITAAALKGWVDVMADQGLPGAYLFNFPYLLQPGFVAKGEDAIFRTLLENRLAVDVVRRGTRRYQVGYQDIVPPSENCQSVLPAVLPPGQRLGMALPMGELPRDGCVIVTPKTEEEPQKCALEVLLNGNEANADGTFATAALRRPQNRIDIINRGEAPVTITNLYLDIQMDT